MGGKQMNKLFRTIFKLKILEVYKCQNEIDLKFCVLSQVG